MTYGIALHEPPVFVFKVRPKSGGFWRHPGGEIWRDIAIAGDQTMEELALYILEAFDFDNDHLSSFFMSGKRWDDASEIRVYDEEPGFSPSPALASPWGWPREEPPIAGDILMRDAPLPGKAGKKEFIYLFDFGDNWVFGVRLIEKQAQIDPHAVYPRIVASMGEAPEQYPNTEGWDEDYDEDAEGVDLIDNNEPSLLPFPTDRTNR